MVNQRPDLSSGNRKTRKEIRHEVFSTCKDTLRCNIQAGGGSKPAFASFKGYSKSRQHRANQPSTSRASGREQTKYWPVANITRTDESSPSRWNSVIYASLSNLAVPR